MCEDETDYKAERAAERKANKLERQLNSKKFANMYPEILEHLNKIKESNKRMSGDIRKLIRGTVVESSGVRMRYSLEYDFSDAVWAGSVSSVEPEGVFKGTGLFELMKSQPFDLGAPDEFYGMIEETKPPIRTDVNMGEVFKDFCEQHGFTFYPPIDKNKFNTGLHE